MSDAMRLQEIIHRELKELLPEYQPDNLLTLVMMVVGILRGRNGQLTKIARHVTYLLGKQTSLVERFRRFVRNPNVIVEAAYCPFAKIILSSVQSETITLMIDTTNLGSCIGLCISVYYKGRGLPLAWVTYKGKKGHSSQEAQIALFDYVHSLISPDKQVVLLGDGEFDGSLLLKWLNACPLWDYVCRIDRTTSVEVDSEWIPIQELSLDEKQEKLFKNLRCVQSNPVESVNIMALWNEANQEHWFFVTSFDSLEVARKWYKKRFTIETLFSDWKSRGFFLAQTRLRHPERVSRLILAGSIAYVFTIMLGVSAILSKEHEKLVRTDFIMHSIFQIGLIYLNHLLNHALEFPDLQDLAPPDSFYFSYG